MKVWGILLASCFSLTVYGFIEKVSILRSPTGDRRIYLWADTHNVGYEEAYAEIDGKKENLYCSNGQQFTQALNVLDSFEAHQNPLDLYSESMPMFGREYTFESVEKAFSFVNGRGVNIDLSCSDGSQYSYSWWMAPEMLTWIFAYLPPELTAKDYQFITSQSVDSRQVFYALSYQFFSQEHFTREALSGYLKCAPYEKYEASFWSRYNEALKIMSDKERKEAQKLKEKIWDKVQVFRAFTDLYNSKQTLTQEQLSEGFDYIEAMNERSYFLELVDAEFLIKSLISKKDSLFIAGAAHTRNVEKFLKHAGWVLEEEFPKKGECSKKYVGYDVSPTIAFTRNKDAFSKDNLKCLALTGPEIQQKVERGFQRMIELTSL